MRVLVVGGYGTFGQRLVNRLQRIPGIEVVVGGRNRAKAEPWLASTGCRWHDVDLDLQLATAIASSDAGLVLDCTGFQADYRVARACIKTGVTCIDIAESRDFVTGIQQLHAEARAAGVAVISGASTVPALSSAVLAHIAKSGGQIQWAHYGISPANRQERGLATIRAVLSFVGQPLPGGTFGWNRLERREIPGLGRRWFSPCDAADRDLMPKEFGLRELQFQAGLELGVLHLGLYALSWLVRLRLIKTLVPLAKPLKLMSEWLLPFGTDEGGMYLEAGTGNTIWRWSLIARSGDGPFTPVLAAAALTREISLGAHPAPGARPCVNLVSLSAIRREAEDLDLQIPDPTSEVDSGL